LTTCGSLASIHMKTTHMPTLCETEPSFMYTMLQCPRKLLIYRPSKLAFFFSEYTVFSLEP
jgi:hypothetical protein